VVSLNTPSPVAAALPDAEHLLDGLLVTLVRSGDRAAGQRLVARWHPRLMRTALRLTAEREAAREAVQEAWLAVWAGLPGLHDADRFGVWAYTVLRRKCVDRIRARVRDRQRLSPLKSTPEPAQAGSQPLRASLDRALAALPVEQQLAAVLWFIDELSLGEVAAATGVPVGTVKSRLSRARGALKLSLAEESPQ
jgi:RNA polymerase sigma-70 factor (ECF subfamily)